MPPQCSLPRPRRPSRNNRRRLVTLNLVDTVNEHAASEAIRKEVHALLTDLAHLPERVTNENWLAELERAEVGTTREHQATPGQLKAQAAKAEIRAARKLETQRQRRAGA
jgi:hypothetical protein